MQKVKYITNKELLSEIHKSKTSFCSFVKPEYASFDAIVLKRENITATFLTEVRQKKADVMTKTTGHPVSASDIPDDQIVFRLMTHEHVPLDPDRKRKSRTTDQSYVRTNFPPFKHLILVNGELQEVGRSHWRGSLTDGHFCMERGTISRRLAEMFMLLVERYSKRGNFRNYSYIDEMRSHALLQLAQVGLLFDESKSENPFAFYTTTIRNSFTRVLNIEKKSQIIRDDLLIIAGATPSYTRQIDHELDHRIEGQHQDTSVKKQVRRGRPPLSQQSED